MFMTYSEKLKDPRWQRKRLEMMQRDDFKCVSCSSEDKTLHVHHKYYVSGREPWDYPPCAYATMCWHCHEIETQQGVDEWRPWESALGDFFWSEDWWTEFSSKLNEWCYFSQTPYPFIMQELFKFVAEKAAEAEAAKK